jgi:hypothetical protein
MSARHLRNISLADYRTYLDRIGCKRIRTSGGHEHYARKDLLRPLTLQSHIDPVPEFIIRNHIRLLGKSRTQFLEEVYSK